MFAHNTMESKTKELKCNISLRVICYVHLSENKPDYKILV